MSTAPGFKSIVRTLKARLRSSGDTCCHTAESRMKSNVNHGPLRRLKLLEEENRKLKQLVADLSLDKHILQDVLSKKL